MFSENDRITLLTLARLSVECAARNEPLPRVILEDHSSVLQCPAATFVTLTKNAMLRGCIGSLEARLPLVLDVIEHAAAAATGDYRFAVVSPDEVSELHIEISVLTPPQRLDYETCDEIILQLRPGRDGVILSHGYQRATFLPQVWEKLPDVEDFMGHLCQKMGANSKFWKSCKPEIFVYQVISFCEAE